MYPREKVERYYPISRVEKSLDWLKMNTRKLDKKGIIMYKIPYTDNFDYYPVEIALFAPVSYTHLTLPTTPYV